MIKQSIIIGEFMNEDVAQRVCDAKDLDHAASGEAHVPAVLFGRGYYLLHPVDVRREGRDDYAALGFSEIA